MTTLTIGASRIRDIVKNSERADGIAFLRLIWPNLSDRTAGLIVDYPGETRVNGSQLILPASWAEVTK